MSEVLYETLSQRLDRFPGSKRRTMESVEPAWIAEAEAELGYRLPDSYIWWLQEFGSFTVSGSWIYTLVPPEHRDLADDDLLYNHRLNIAADWRPAGRLYIFTPDADEDFYFDVSAPITEAGVPVEYPVMRFDHLMGEAELYADSFAGFLEQLLQERGY
ncbi:hypothetical protein B9G55_04365 [Saccharibacillus sp. O16]|nr:hypothetical protein B9G55_04365 [Saccharibacillus sp. O16]